MPEPQAYEFDAFISHASEDKDSLVRPLAEALRTQRLSIWYDEITLRPGDSLRRSIDAGLSKSRMGIVVLSKSFFLKRWTQWELDGLVQLNLSGQGIRLCPIWHGVTQTDVRVYSPPLADIVALDSARGVAVIAESITTLLRPAQSPIARARSVLDGFGFAPPPLTDDWWIELAIDAHRLVGGGDDAPWAFLAPFKPDQWRDHAWIMAWGAMQQGWTAIARERRIGGTTPPDEVLAFIESEPGLSQAATAYPRRLLEHAPQLAIPELSGPFSAVFDQLQSDDQLPPLAFRGSARWRELPSGVSNQFCRSMAKYGIEPFDVLVWLFSSSSGWMPDDAKRLLLAGFGEDLDLWLWGVDKSSPMARAARSQLPPEKRQSLRRYPEFGSLAKEALLATRLPSGAVQITAEAMSDVERRVSIACDRLGLTDPPTQLVQAFVSSRLTDAGVQSIRRSGRFILGTPIEF
jgi:hypothetical protein